MSGNIINTSQGLIEFQSHGTGRPVLVLHGGHSNCREEMAIGGFNLHDFRFIIPSRPGYGKTPLAGNETIVSAAALMAALLEALKLERVIVYAISAGGPTALQMAADYPEKVEKLLLASAVTKDWLDPSGKVYRTANKLFHPRSEGFTWAMVRFFARLMPIKMAESFFKEFSTREQPELSHESVSSLIAALKKFRSGKGFLNDLKHHFDSSTLARIKCPVLICHSRNDASVPISHPELAKRQIPDARLVVLDNQWGHLIWIGPEQQETFRLLTQFML